MQHNAWIVQQASIRHRQDLRIEMFVWSVIRDHMHHQLEILLLHSVLTVRGVNTLGSLLQSLKNSVCRARKLSLRLQEVLLLMTVKKNAPRDRLDHWDIAQNAQSPRSKMSMVLKLVYLAQRIVTAMVVVHTAFASQASRDPMVDHVLHVRQECTRTQQEQEIVLHVCQESTLMLLQQLLIIHATSAHKESISQVRGTLIPLIVRPAKEASTPTPQVQVFA